MILIEAYSLKIQNPTWIAIDSSIKSAQLKLNNNISGLVLKNYMYNKLDFLFKKKHWFFL